MIRFDSSHTLGEDRNLNLAAHMAISTQQSPSIYAIWKRWKRVKKSSGAAQETSDQPNLARLYMIVLGVFLTCMASAEEKLGTKADIVLPKSESFSGPGVGIAPILQMVVAVGIVVALLKFALPKLMPMMNKKMTTSLGSQIRVEESATFAGGSLFVVSARKRSLLLCVNSQGVQVLSDLTDTPVAAPQVQPVATPSATPQPKVQKAAPTHAVIPDEAPAFFEMLDEKMVETPKAQPRKSEEELLNALDRLTRLTGTH